MTDLLCFVCYFGFHLITIARLSGESDGSSLTQELKDWKKSARVPSLSFISAKAVETPPTQQFPKNLEANSLLLNSQYIFRRRRFSGNLPSYFPRQWGTSSSFEESCIVALAICTLTSSILCNHFIFIITDSTASSHSLLLELFFRVPNCSNNFLTTWSSVHDTDLGYPFPSPLNLHW